MRKHRIAVRLMLTVAMGVFMQAGFAQNDLQIRPIMHVNAAAPVALSSAEVTVTTAGDEAWIRYDLVFQNPNARVLEGQLDFPLADGQQVVGFALDINGEMREAVPVPKAKGRAVFESIERRNVDPALLEQTAGNHYNLRVYPIPANGTRRVRLWVAQSLKREDNRYSLPLMLDFARSVQRIPLSVEGAERAHMANVGRRMAWSAKDQRTWTVLDARDLDRSGQLRLEWQAGESPSVLVQRAPQGDFALVDLPLADATPTASRFRHLALIWDASLSGLGRDQDLELAALERLLAKAGDVRVSLQVLRNRVDAPRVFEIRDGDSAALQAAIRALPYDGATRASAIRPVVGADRYLYVGDGLFNLGVDAVPTLPARLDAWANGAADAPALRAWTARHRGQLFMLDGTASLPRVDDMFSTPAVVDRVMVPGGTDAVLESPFADADGRIRFAVQRQSNDAIATVHWHDARGAFTTVVPLAGEAKEGRMAAYTWARLKMAGLEANRAMHRTELQELGKRFGIPNSESSLIVLDSVADYANFDIPPPATLLAQWTALKAEKALDARIKTKAKLDGLAERYDERGQWWAKKFPKDAPDLAPDRSAVAVDAMAPMVMSAPPSPPEPSRVAMERASEADGERAMMAQSRARPAAAAARDAAGIVASQPTATIRIQAWKSDAPEAKRLRAAPASELYATYLDARKAMRSSPAFYMDAAEVMRERGEPLLAQRVLSNLAELQIEDRHLLRLLAYRLEELGAWDEALPLLKRVLELAPDEPQSHRDLALALQATGHYQAAADAFYAVASGQWDSRFSDIDLISLVELNALINKHADKVRITEFDQRLIKHYPVGLRTVLSWDADNSDMDLWVTDPNGERVYYGHTASYQGGRISRDFTGGYGPEEFVLRVPKKGRYKVEANYFGDRHQVLAGETTLMLVFSTGYGTSAQKDQRVTLRLKDKKETIAVGEFVVE